VKPIHFSLIACALLLLVGAGYVATYVPIRSSEITMHSDKGEATVTTLANLWGSPLWERRASTRLEHAISALSSNMIYEYQEEGPLVHFNRSGHWIVRERSKAEGFGNFGPWTVTDHWFDDGREITEANK
jgi:hypothetical protein